MNRPQFGPGPKSSDPAPTLQTAPNRVRRAAARPAAHGSENQVHLTGAALAGTIGFHYISPWTTLAAWLVVATLLKVPLEGLGYVYRADNPERTKRYFREPPGTPRTHIHVRKLGSFSQQFPLLLRDYLRAHPAELPPYEDLKRRLAAQHPHDGAAYTEAKLPWFWETILRADAWAQATGWEPGPSDA